MSTPPTRVSNATNNFFRGGRGGGGGGGGGATAIDPQAPSATANSENTSRETNSSRARVRGAPAESARPQELVKGETNGRMERGAAREGGGGGGGGGATAADLTAEGRGSDVLKLSGAIYQVSSLSSNMSIYNLKYVHIMCPPQYVPEYVSYYAGGRGSKYTSPHTNTYIFSNVMQNADLRHGRVPPHTSPVRSLLRSFVSLRPPPPSPPPRSLSLTLSIWLCLSASPSLPFSLARSRARALSRALPSFLRLSLSPSPSLFLARACTL
jgi:hypothetical protein